MAKATVTFETKALHRPMTIDVVFPTDKTCMATEYLPKRKEKMQTLYLLEGLTGTFLGPSSYTRIQALAEDYNICVVMTCCDNKWYADSSISGDLYETAIVRDLIRFTRDSFNLSDKREDTFIGGFSMGGFGANNLGLLHPDLFGHIITISAALNKDRFEAAMDTPGINDVFTAENYATMFGLKDIKDFPGCRYDYEANAEKLAASGAPKPIYHIYAGSDETVLCEKNMRWAKKLQDLGFDVESGVIEGTGHSWYGYQSGVAAALESMQQKHYIDGFQGNVEEFPTNANFAKNGRFFGWNVYYNVIRDKQD